MNTAAVLIVIIAAVILLWRWWLRTHPDTPCWWCKGTGENRLSTRKHKGDCRHCGGSGKRRSRLLGK